MPQILSNVVLLQNKDIETTKLTAVDIISQLVDISPYVVREFMMQEANSQPEVTIAVMMMITMPLMVMIIMLTVLIMMMVLRSRIISVG